MQNQNQNQGNFPQGAAQIKQATNGNHYMGGWFKLNNQMYFLRLTKKNQPDKKGNTYNVWVEQAPPQQNQQGYQQPQQNQGYQQTNQPRQNHNFNQIPQQQTMDDIPF